jgi:hypothetical protein
MGLAKLKKLLLVLAVLLPSYSYSESIAPYYGYTGNAAANGNSWAMPDVFPSDIPGLDVQNIIYNYTIQKETEDQVDVTIQNENALGPGYVFQETDRWKPGSLGGTKIQKAVPVVPNIPREAWGDGSIEVDGNGSVIDPSVVYTYKVDPCYDPQFDPNCPGYKQLLPEVQEVDISTLYDATEDSKMVEYTDDELYDNKDQESDEDKEAKQKEEEKDSKERLEKALAAADNSAMFANAIAQAQMLDAMSLAANMNSYYTTSIPGGVYKETTALVDKKIPDNRNGLRNGLAQQLLHEKMVDMQY